MYYSVLLIIDSQNRKSNQKNVMHNFCGEYIKGKCCLKIRWDMNVIYRDIERGKNNFSYFN